MAAYLEPELAIKVEGLKKKYYLGQFNIWSFANGIQSKWARLRHKEDPNAVVGTKVGAHNEVFWALDGVDLTVRKGEAIGVIGANGAGKSTLLKLISRITAPTAGRILINGRISSMLEVGTGFNREMTGRENVFINGAILGMTKREINEKLESIIAFSECEQFIDTPVKRYSSGMYVKLAFAVAAHLDNEIIIMDEVLAVGDVRFQKKCTDKMRSLSRDSGKTILFVSHNINSIRQVCSRVIVLEHGKIVYDGDTESAIERYINCANTLSPAVALNGLPREQWYKPGARLLQIQTADQSVPVCKQGDKLRLSVDWRSLDNHACVALAVTVKRADGTPVGRAYTNPLRDIRANTAYRTAITLDVGALMPDKYSLALEVVHIDEAGKTTMLDGLDGCFSIEIKDWDALGAQWYAQGWGSVLLPEMEAVNEPQSRGE